MIFSRPVPYEEALQSSAVKSTLLTTGTSRDLARLAPEIRERARFSAQVTMADYVNEFGRLVDRIISPDIVIEADGTRRPAAAGEYMDPATFRLEMKALARKLGYQPDPGKRGSIQDLTSDKRLDLIREMNVGFAHSYGWWQQGQTEAILDEWPAQELFRAEDREVPRDWETRWNDARGNLGEATSALDGRVAMVALKNDPIWEEISAFGLPYPPFDFNSGMDVRDVSRREAEEFGLMLPGDPAPEAESRGFRDDLALPADQIEGSLIDSIIRAMGSDVEFVDGVLQFVGAEQ